MKSMRFHILLAMILFVAGRVQSSSQVSTHKIGLLLRDSRNQVEMEVARSVVDAANAELRPGDNPFELVIRTVEGPWGAGSKESVSLVYEDSVLLYLGALDGWNAHLAEQVAAKGHMVYIETRATEPTLTQAYVPWFIRVVPNDDQQAEKLVTAISESGGGSMLVLTRDDSDTRYACRSLLRAGARVPGISPLKLEWKSGGDEFGAMPDEIIAKAPEHLVLTFWSEEVFRMSRVLLKLHPEIRQYAHVNFLSGLQHHPETVNIPKGLLASTGYGYLDYLADGLRLAMDAIQKYGTDRDVLKEKIPEIEFNGGSTGPISFDEMGNRMVP